MTLFDHEVLGHHVIVFGVLSGWTVTAEVLGIMCCLGSVIGWGRGGAADLATSSELERAMAWKVKTEPEKNKQTRTHPVWYSEHRPCQARFCLGTRWQVFGTSACRDSGPAGCFLAAGVIIYIYISQAQTTACHFNVSFNRSVSVYWPQESRELEDTRLHVIHQRRKGLLHMLAHVCIARFVRTSM